VLERLAAFAVRHAKAVLLAAVLTALVAGAVGAGVAGRLSTGGFTDPGSSSARAERLLTDRLHRPPANLVLMVTAPGPVTSPAVAADGLALTNRLAADPGVVQVASYWSLGSPPELVSRDGRSALVVGRVTGAEPDVRRTVRRLGRSYAQGVGSLRVRVGGSAEVTRAIDERAEADLRRAEVIALPVTLVLLVLVFGGLVAALLPLGVALVATLSTMALLRGLTELTPVSLFALNLTTGLGLGLAVDYCLFVISRYREELRRGAAGDAAIVRALATAGRTVLFSAVTVAGCLAALLVFPLGFLRSTAYAGILVVTLSLLGALVLLPALLVVLGPRIDALDPLRRIRPRAGRHRASRGLWYDLADRVLRRPLLGVVGITVLLAVLATPFLHVRFANADDRTLPASAPARQTQDALRTEFALQLDGQAFAVLPSVDPATEAGRAVAARYTATLSTLPGVEQAEGPTGRYREGARSAGPSASVPPGPTVVAVLPRVDPGSPAAEQVIRAMRRIGPADTLVAGPTADQLDARAAIAGRTPLALLLVTGATAALVLVLTGGVLLAGKAIIVNVLSLSASFGAMVWVFQDGHLQAAVGDFTVTGAIDASTPILLFCIAFGLSMDYEILLLSRIKEAYDAGADTAEAVRVGLQASAGLMTAAAAIVAAVFLALMRSDVAFLKLLGLGLATAVILDATVVRGVLVPACVGLAGRANWWAPAALRGWVRRLDPERRTTYRPRPTPPAPVSPSSRQPVRHQPG
jgi:RND superfamily putative drug exporter